MPLPAHIKRAESSAEGSGLVKYVGRILVEDASGCRFEVHEYSKRSLLADVRSFALDTGEVVNLVDANTFLIETTGERLVRVR